MTKLEDLLREHPELRNKKVTYADLLQIFSDLVDTLTKSSNSSIDVVNRVFNVLEKTIDQLRYERLRDLMFIEAIIAKANHIEQDSIHANYKNFCNEFDKLNGGNNTNED